MHRAAQALPEEALRCCRRLQLVALITKVLGLFGAEDQGPSPALAAATQGWLAEAEAAAGEPGAAETWDWADGLRMIRDVAKDAVEGTQTYKEAPVSSKLANALVMELLAVARRISEELLPQPRMLPEVEGSPAAAGPSSRAQPPRAPSPEIIEDSLEVPREDSVEEVNSQEQLQCMKQAPPAARSSREVSHVRPPPPTPKSKKPRTAGSSEAGALLPTPRFTYVGGPPCSSTSSRCRGDVLPGSSGDRAAASTPSSAFAGLAIPAEGENIAKVEGAPITAMPVAAASAALSSRPAEQGRQPLSQQARALFEAPLQGFEVRRSPQRAHARLRSAAPASAAASTVARRDVPGRERQYQPWSDEEEQRLLEGHRQYRNQWELIRHKFDLMHRLGTQLKDKYRNLVRAGVV